MRLSLDRDDIARDPDRVIVFIGKFHEKYNQLVEDYQEINEKYNQLVEDYQKINEMHKHLHQEYEEIKKDNEEIRLENNKIKLENEGSKLENQKLQARLQKIEAQLAKYISPHIPSSKQLYPKKRSGLPRSQSKQKRGGSKKGKSGVTWDQKEPDEEIHSYVKECLNCHRGADEADQKTAYTKRIVEIPDQIKVSVQEHYIHMYKCECGKITQAEDPTIEGTSLGPNFLAFLTSARYRTGGSFENLSRMIEDISGVRLSQTALNRGLSKVCDSLEPVAVDIATEVMNSDYFNIDETGHKLVLERKRSQQGSKKIWVWVFGTPQCSILSCRYDS